MATVILTIPALHSWRDFSLGEEAYIFTLVSHSGWLGSGCIRLLPELPPRYWWCCVLIHGGQPGESV